MTRIEQLLADIKNLIENEPDPQLSDFYLRSFEASVVVIVAGREAQRTERKPIGSFNRRGPAGDLKVRKGIGPHGSGFLGRRALHRDTPTPKE